ncbi:hypothetical protein [Bdellovibrio bacteriovorus]|uniref:hypothetical protein n=1 Tax=Bdellovibrio bacteriovorus TaxID=959 RepID=UPI0035A714F2
MSEVNEVIKHAAVMSNQGWIFLGKCHADCFMQMRNVGVKVPNGSMHQGFVTNLGRYVTRDRALDIAVNAGQIQKQGQGKVLISEMLWNASDCGKFKYDSIRGYYE